MIRGRSLPEEARANKPMKMFGGGQLFVRNTLTGIDHNRRSTPVEIRNCRFAYFRAAQAYMLISMPTGTSTILGVFQAIRYILANGRHFVVPAGRIRRHLR
jgi:hypothetical protein